MREVVIPLQDVLTDFDESVDLTNLTSDELIVHLHKLYDFLPTTAVFSVTEGDLTIEIPEVDPYQEQEALRTHKKAGRNAERGRYQSAIRLFKEVLETLPSHADARRDLAITYVEEGNTEAAKKHLIEVLRLKPKDAWAYLVLGNLSMQFENDPDSAERFYQKGCELDPEDAYLLNSYGALMAKQGHLHEARTMFRKAIEQAPDYPNPRYGLALSYADDGESSLALNALRGLFEAPESSDTRREPVYDQARNLFLHINQRLAQETHAQMMDRLERIIDEFADHTGYPIHIEQDSTLSVTAATQLAWVYGRQWHTIKYKATAPAVLPHLLAHEFEHVLLAHEARNEARGQTFISTDDNKEYAERFFGAAIGKMRRQGFDAQTIKQFMDQIFQGMVNQIYNIPLDMIIESRLNQKYEFLRPSQVVSLDATQQENLKVLKDTGIRDLTPNRIYRSSVTLNCAYAVFTDFLFGGATGYAEPFRKTRYYATGRSIFDIWQDTMSGFQPGDEFDLVDKLAQILKLHNWYEWRPDADVGSSSNVPSGEGPEGVTNPDLLKEKEPAALMYCLDALRLFESMDDSEVLAIASEIALLGRSGLDYASSEQKYTLRSLQGKRFTGLQLMCYMYVGFKRVDPSVDTGMPLEDAYASATAMFQSGEQ